MRARSLRLALGPDRFFFLPPQTLSVPILSLTLSISSPIDDSLLLVVSSPPPLASAAAALPPSASTADGVGELLAAALLAASEGRPDQGEAKAAEALSTDPRFAAAW